jgi:hypothetical protein
MELTECGMFLSNAYMYTGFTDFFVELTSIICSYVASLTQPFAFSSERDGTRMSAKNTIAFYLMRGVPCGE